MPHRPRMPRPRWQGSRPLKLITVRIVPKEGEGVEEKLPFHAPDGRYWAEESVEEVLDRVIDYLDGKYPAWEFRLVALKGGGQFNFVYDGPRAPSALAEVMAKREGKVDSESEGDSSGVGGIVHGQGT